MGWLDGLKALVNAVNTEYDRRIRSASNVKEYKVGHAANASHTHVERVQGEGGAVGELQSNAGPHLADEEVPVR